MDKIYKTRYNFKELGNSIGQNIPYIKSGLVIDNVHKSSSPNRDY
jgi:hypothetical protein